MTTESNRNVSVLKITNISESRDLSEVAHMDSGGRLQNTQNNCAKNNEPLNMLMICGVSSSVIINSNGSELSPVRWHDSEVDPRVYLGTSGWVQVERPSAKDNRNFSNGKNKVESADRTKIFKSEICRESKERKEKYRPIYLPITLEKDRDKNNYKLSCSSYLNLEPGSSHCITPIISPPPGFKDAIAVESEPHKNSVRRCETGKSSSFVKSINISKSEYSPGAPGSGKNFPDSKNLSVQKFTHFSVPEKRALDQCEIQKTKFLENKAPDKIHIDNSVESTLFSSAGRFDDDTQRRVSNKLFPIEPNVTHSVSRRSDDKTKYEDRGATKPQSCVKLEKKNNNLHHFQHLTQFNPQKEKETGFLVFSSSNRQFSTSSTLSSSSSTSSLSSAESSFSLSNYSPRSKTCSVRRRKFQISGNRNVISLDDCQQTKNLDFGDDGSLKVRRSRSLQLPKERCSNSKNSFSFFCTPRNQLSNHYFLSEVEDEEQYSSNDVKKFEICSRYQVSNVRETNSRTQDIPREAAEEVQIISDFLSQRRSRAAARNLLLHRYLNGPKDDDQKENGKQSEYGTHCFGTDRKCKKKKFQASNARLKPSHFSIDACGDEYSHDFFMKSTNFANDHVDYEPAVNFIAPAASSSPSILSEFFTNGNTKKYSSYESDCKNITNKNICEGKTTLNCVSLNLTNGFDLPSVNSRICKFSVSSNPCLPFQETDDGSNKKEKFQSTPVTVSVKHGSSEIEQRRKNYLETRVDESNSFDYNGSNQNVYFNSKINKNNNKKISGKRFNRYSWAASSLSEVHLKNVSSKKNAKQKNCNLLISFDDHPCEVSEKFHEDSLEMKVQQEMFNGRPGSAPTKKTESGNLINAHQRSFSLPKSFRPEKKGFVRIKESNLFPRDVKVTENNLASNAWDNFSETSLSVEKQSHRLVRHSQLNHNLMRAETSSSSLPNELLDFTTSEFISVKNVGRFNSKKITSASRNRALTSNASGLSENAMHTLKKNSLMRMKNNSLVKNNGELIEYTTQNAKNNYHSLNYEKINTQISNTENIKSRFGSFIWRSDRNCKKSKKIIGNTECSSGDSGIHVEYAEHFESDEMKSQDTDQPGDLHNSVDSAAQERDRSNSLRKRIRSMSNLKEQRLLNSSNQNCYYMRLISASSLIREKFTTNHSKEFGSTDRLNSFRSIESREKEQLKRSFSHPTELNKLSSLWNSKITAVKSFTSDEEEITFEDEILKEKVLFESEPSIDRLTGDSKRIFEMTEVKEILLAEALWDHVAIESDELPFRAGDVIEILDTSDRNWWWGTAGERFGYFPSAFVRIPVNQKGTVEDCLTAVVTGKDSNFERKRTNISLLSDDQVRSSIVKELLKTERDFVKVLKDVTEGYVVECRKRTDLFTKAQLKSIFSNIEDLLIFQKKFLHDLEERVDLEYPYKSCIGEIFFNHKSGFQMYSEYCNSHPMAIATLQELYKNTDCNNFFESCRLIRGLMKIPLDGYLLTPIQRICKYPLQLAELLKYTKSDHPDYEMVRRALETMRKVATLINERKRKMESLEKLAAWQRRVDGWQGDNLVALSSQLIHQGDVVKINSGVRNNNITLFLFDHQIVYCKKDLLKRNLYVYKGRIFLDSTDVTDLPDGKTHHFGMTIKHGIKIYDHIEKKWLVFCCSSDKEKAEWLEALLEERKLVAEDKREGLELSPATRKLAAMFANYKNIPNKPKSL